VTQPQNADPDAPLGTIQVKMVDDAGAIATNDSAVVSISLAAGGSLNGTTSVHAVAGVASFIDLSVDQPSVGYELRASSSGLASAFSQTFDVLGGAAATLNIDVPTAPQGYGHVFHVNLTVLDASAHIFTDTITVNLSLASNPAGVTLDGPVSQLVQNGLAAFALSIGTPGSYAIVATAHNLPPKTSTSITFVGYTSVGTGDRHTCGAANTALYCWGYNVDGELGIGLGGSAAANRNVPVFVPGAGGITQLQAGKMFTCANGGSTECWGANDQGQLGIGSTTSPVLVPTNSKGSFRVLAAGASHGCGLGPFASLTAWCWGSNAHGELGTGTRDSSTSPIHVGGGLSFVRISAGGDHTCGIDSTAAAYCWGANASGQLGDSLVADTALPVKVVGGLTFTSITAGATHTCAIATGGTTYCWGANDHGQLGNGTTSASPTAAPVAVVGGPFVLLSAGESHTCGIIASGALYCWGNGLDGRLGNGGAADVSTPTAVSGTLVFGSVSTGGSHSCALTTANILYCWGKGNAGQIGNGSLNGSPTPVKVLVP
jgi:alpha-tubulin suppressor-like RCC1 family protein